VSRREAGEHCTTDRRIRLTGRCLSADVVHVERWVLPLTGELPIHIDSARSRVSASVGPAVGTAVRYGQAPDDRWLAWMGLRW
jgi:hypothetical protein